MLTITLNNNFGMVRVWSFCLTVMLQIKIIFSLIVHIIFQTNIYWLLNHTWLDFSLISSLRFSVIVYIFYHIFFTTRKPTISKWSKRRTKFYLSHFASKFCTKIDWSYFLPSTTYIIYNWINIPNTIHHVYNISKESSLGEIRFFIETHKTNLQR